MSTETTMYGLEVPVVMPAMKREDECTRLRTRDGLILNFAPTASHH